ncbi:MAG: peptidylprolyl isomerase [candidate division WOR-3 bacterium]
MSWLMMLFAQTTAFSGSATPVGQEELLDQVVAIVGTEPITLGQLEVLFIIYAEQLPPGINKDAARRRILEEMVNQKLLYYEAKADTAIKVTQEEIDQAIDQQLRAIKKEMGEEEFARQLAMEGLTEERLRVFVRGNIEVSLYIQKLVDLRIKPNIIITQDEARRFYDENKDSIAVEPASYRLSHILIRIEPSGPAEQEAYNKAKGISKQLVGGADFAEMAFRYSDDRETAPAGGMLGWVPRLYLSPDVLRELDALRPGEISKPLRGETGYHIFQLLDRRGDALMLRHILVNVVPEKADSSAAMMKVKKVMNLAKGGKNFADLARAYSADPDAKEMGGDLGWIPEDMMTQEMIAALRDAKPGDIVGPIPSPLGYSIVKVSDKKDKVVHSYEEIADRVKNYLYQKRVQEELDKLLERIKQRVYVEIRL